MSYIGSPPSTQSFAPGTDTFSGDGTTVAFTLSRNVATVNDILVVVNNVDQQPSNYTVANNILTFSPAPSAGTNNIYVRYLSTNLQSIVPQYGSVVPSSLSTPNALYWDTSGNVGVGTTSPSVKLNVVSAANTASAVFTDATQSTLTFKHEAGNLLTYDTAGTATQRWVLNSAERMRIDPSGNVGVGTTTPLTRLDLGSIVHGTPGTGVTASLWKDGVSNFFGFGVSAGQLNYIAGTTSANGHVFYSNNAERMRIDTLGNLLVGTTNSTPISGLALKGLAFGSDFTTATAIGINTTNTSGTSYFLGFARGQTICGSISSAGANSTSYTTSSDYRLKEDVQPMTGALAKVSALKPVTYKWKADGSDGEGFIAHELQAIVPEAVVGEKDAVDDEGNPKYQGVDTSFLVATLTAAIQEQQAMIEELKTKVAALEAR
jgi:hypothetical protein